MLRYESTKIPVTFNLYENHVGVYLSFRFVFVRRFAFFFGLLFFETVIKLVHGKVQNRSKRKPRLNAPKKALRS